MELDVDVNELLRAEVTKVDSRLLTLDLWENRDAWPAATLRNFQEQMRLILDEMGNASAIAQSLQQVITSADRLKYSDHLIYFLKDATGNQGRGILIGFLKIGPKNLFVYDQHGNQHELRPMCVLDFYVHESMQRLGCGKRLFEYMLEDQGIRAHHLAVDRPSDKFLNFLRKHYGLTHSIPQVNNFVVFKGFFDGQIDWSVGIMRRGSTSSMGSLDWQMRMEQANGKRGLSGIELEDTHNYTPRTSPFSRQQMHMGVTGGSTVAAGCPTGKGSTIRQIMESNGNDGMGSLPPSPLFSRTGSPKNESLAVQVSERSLASAPAKLSPTPPPEPESSSPTFPEVSNGRVPSPTPSPYRDLKFTHQRLW